MRFRTTVLAAAGLAFLALAGGPVTAQEEQKPDGNGAKLTDQQILQLYYYANSAQIFAGQVAQEKGTAAQVKDMARAFGQDHTRLKGQAKDLAQRLGLTIGKPMAPEPTPSEPNRPEPTPSDPNRPEQPAPDPMPSQDAAQVQDPWVEDSLARAELPAEFRTHDLVETQRKAMEEFRGKTGDEFDIRYADYEVSFHEDAVEALREDLIPAVQNEELKQLLQNAVPAFEAHLARAREVRERIAAASQLR